MISDDFWTQIVTKCFETLIKMSKNRGKKGYIFEQFDHNFRAFSHFLRPTTLGIYHKGPRLKRETNLIDLLSPQVS